MMGVVAWTRALHAKSYEPHIEAATNWGALVGVLKARCHADDHQYFALQVAMAIDGIHVALVGKVLSRYPELEAEMEASLGRTGNVMP